MKRFINRLSGFGLISTILILSISCVAQPTTIGSSPASVIVGKWQQQGAPSSVNIEFLKDGTYKMDYAGMSGQYFLPDDTHIKLLGPNYSVTYVFSISGDTLTLTNVNGSDGLHYQRKK